MIGYLLFGITFLFYIGLISINISQPKTAGDAGMGYGLALFALSAGFALSSLLLTISVAWKEGFLWVSDQAVRRTWLVGAGWLFLAATTFACAVFKWEWHEGEFPQYLRWLAVANGQLWIPLFMFVPYFMLLSLEIKSSVPVQAYSIPLMVGFTISAVCATGLLYGWVKISAQSQAAQIQRIHEDDRRIHQEHLSYISEQKPTDPIVNILSLTGRFHEEDVRTAAIAKIKEHPDWEADLIRLLDNEYYFSEVYTFIDGNKVDHPDLFPQPINRSILLMASQIKKQILEANNLQHWHFENYGIERLLRAIDEQFLNRGVDFRPAVVKLREALSTKPPERFKNVRFTITPVVDKWLKKHATPAI
jgi:hypothetical protein